jgi:hypothetical protein
MEGVAPERNLMKHRVLCLLFPSLVPLGIAPAQVHDYAPTESAILNTNYQVLRTANNQWIVVRDGLFVFRNVTIPSGIAIRGVGTNPMIWLVTGDLVVDGELSVRGFDGQQVNTLNSANFAVLGGIGGAAGGFGGNGSPQTTQRSMRGDSGYGPFQIPGLGGQGGAAAMGTSTIHYGSGGGGGVFATAGDPWWRATGPLLPEERGPGGAGNSVQGLVPGGLPGTRIFQGSPHDDFWGLGYDVFGRRFVRGELPLPIGGQGGGGGGDRYPSLSTPFITDNQGGGGGGGGGVLLVYALGKIVVGPGGRIDADGGYGGGGEDVGACRQGGGGGGGSGGLVWLASRRFLELHVKGDTWARGDASFVVSADGGIGRNSGFGNPARLTKYPVAVGAPNAGGFGGMGIVQLVTPVGANADGTNTVFDDSILLYRNNVLLAGAEKQRFLAWRGWPNAQSVLVDDFGRPTNVGQEGDIRPSPVLLPLF